MKRRAILYSAFAFCVLTVASCGNDSDTPPKSPDSANEIKTIEFSEPLQGSWKLLVYAGKQEKTFQRGKGELLVIKANACHLHFADAPLTPTNFGINKAEEVYNSDGKKIVCWKRSQDNLLLTVIDNTTQEVDWRGSYLRDTFYQELVQNEQLSLGALASLSVCMEYWYDLYDESGSPRSLATPMKIDSKGYTK
jgi:hypothetical protein